MTEVQAYIYSSFSRHGHGGSSVNSTEYLHSHETLKGFWLNHFTSNITETAYPPGLFVDL